MKNYEVKVTQDLSGYYEGTLVIFARSLKEAFNKLERMSKQKIDDNTDWTHGDEYAGNINSIEIDKSSINKIF